MKVEKGDETGVWCVCVCGGGGGGGVKIYRGEGGVGGEDKSF